MTATQRRTSKGPVTQVRLNHPTYLPVYGKVNRYRRHPTEGPPVALLSGGSGARALAETLIHYTHNSSHILPVFDDGGSSRVLRQHFGMPPPGDLRNRLMSLSDMSRRGNPEVNRLFRARLPAEGEPEALEAQLRSYLDESNPRMGLIEPRYRRIIIRHLERFVEAKPEGFDLRGGNIGNFVITGAYLSLQDLESVIFEFSALAAVRGAVYPVCRSGDYHLKALLDDGTEIIGQANITSLPHPPIAQLSIVERRGDQWQEARPTLNPLAARAIEKAALIGFTMGSFYTSLMPSALVSGMGEAVRRSKRPKVFVANLYRDEETPRMAVRNMISELVRALRRSDSQPGRVTDYVHYALLNDHGDTDDRGRMPVDLAAVRDLGVEPVVLPLERDDGTHDPELVAAVLLSLC